MIFLAMILGGWALACGLAFLLGPATNYSWTALVLCLCVGAGISIAAVVLS
jgi:hypothetical protein